jgi:hypothetical protein
MRGGERELETCECGNRLREGDIAMCEWCENPDVPYYKSMWDALYQLDSGGLNDPYTFVLGGIEREVWATSRENALLILKDHYNVNHYDGGEEYL